MGLNSKTSFVETFLMCNHCSTIQKIHRKESKQKKVDHIKHMYCPKCQDTVEHTEVKETQFLPKWIREDDA